MRKVWLVKAPVSAGAGAVVQVPTQCWLSGMSYLPIWRGVMGSANLMPEAIPSPSQSAGGPAPPVPPVLSGRDQASPTPTTTIPQPLRVTMLVEIRYEYGNCWPVPQYEFQ